MKDITAEDRTFVMLYFRLVAYPYAVLIGSSPCLEHQLNWLCAKTLPTSHMKRRR